MSARRDLRFFRGDHVHHTIIFGSDQSAYTFTASIDQDPDNFPFEVSVTGASVSLMMAGTVTADLDDSSHSWRLVRSIDDAPTTLLTGSVIVED